MQGPFTAQQMLQWWHDGKLPGGLPVCGVAAELAVALQPAFDDGSTGALLPSLGAAGRAEAHGCARTMCV